MEFKLARQNSPNYMVLNINNCNPFSSPIYINVLIQRRAIKKYNQPAVKKIILQMLTHNCCKCNHKNARRQRKKASM